MFNLANDERLEWPKFCYPSEDTIPQTKTTDEKNGRSKNTNHLGFRSDMFVIPRAHSVNHTNLPFSDLMRSMAKKYQSSDLNQQFHEQTNRILSFSGVSHINTFTSSLEMVKGKRSATAIQAQNHFIDAKKQRMEYPLNLSKTHLVNSDDADFDSLSVESSSDVDCWTVDQVCHFVSQLDFFQQEYVEALRDHSIDGSALLVLTEDHLTGILGLKLGPAIRLRNIIRDLHKSPSICSNDSC